MKVIRTAAVATALLSLAGCGGGGVSSTPGPTLTPSPTPTPAPTPTPTPAPPPAPTPTPTPTQPPLAGAISANLQEALRSGGLDTTACRVAACGGSRSGISYDSSTNSYSLSFIGLVSINAADQVSGPVSGFKYFNNAGRPGQRNIILAYDNATAAQALTFTSYIVSMNTAASMADISVNVFGLPSVALPTAGKGTYSGSVGGFANDGSNNFVIKGTSDLTVDFAQQSYRTSLNFTGTNLVAGGPALANRSYAGSSPFFAYPLNASTEFFGLLTGTGGTTGTGSFNGRIFGPSQTEYGYVFKLFDGSMTALGAATGTQQSFTAAAAQPVPVATALPAAVLNSLQAGTLSGGDFAALNETTSGSLIKQTSIMAPISYDATTGLYTLTLVSPGGTTKFADGDAIAGALADMAFYRTLNKDPDTRFQDVYGNRIGAYDTTILPNVARHSGVLLTYTSFALSIAQTDGGVPHSYLATTFGVPATSVPMTGSASYSGIVSGFARASGAIVYMISGTSSLTANFATNSYSTTLSFSGQTLDGSQSLATQNYSGTSSGSLMNGSALNGTLSGSGSGNWAGRFYGPAAAEYGYTFDVAGAGYNAVGVAVGKRD